MKLTFQVCTLEQDGTLKNIGNHSEDSSIASAIIRSSAKLNQIGPLYMQGIIITGSQTRIVYVNPEWKLGDEPVDWRPFL